MRKSKPTVQHWKIIRSQQCLLKASNHTVQAIDVISNSGKRA
jgi:hypothetical protein